MKTRDQRPDARHQTTACRQCGGRGHVVIAKDGKTKVVRCVMCRGSGTGGAQYLTK